MSTLERPSPPKTTELPAISAPKRWLYAGLGCLFVGLAVAGALLPILPTTPFVLLASWCFSRSSPRLSRWLERSPLFGPMLRDWRRHRGVRLHVKYTAIGTLAVVVLLAVIFRSHSLPVLLGTCIVACVGAAVVWRLPTVK